MDQTSLQFEFLDNKCCDAKGAKTVWVKTQRSGWDKRQATLMVYMSADGVNRCKPLLIFHGKDIPKNKEIQAEMKKYDSGVVVIWNEQAWCNVTVMIQ